jgi:riboflavin transporter FmnP
MTVAMNRLQKLAVAASLAALAYALGLLPASFPFPLLPFLRFDLAEIPDIFSFLLLGWKFGLMTALAHWYALVVTATGVFAPPPIPQLMKLTAVLAMFLGVHVGLKVSEKVQRGRLLLPTVGGIIARAGVMAPVTFALYYFLFPRIYIPFGKRTLTAVGFAADTDLIVATLITGLTALFNAISSAYLVPLGFQLVKAVKKALGPQLKTVAEQA